MKGKTPSERMGCMCVCIALNRSNATFKYTQLGGFVCVYTVCMVRVHTCMYIHTLVVIRKWECV